MLVLINIISFFIFFFFNDTATTEIYTLSLHDALPTSSRGASTSRSSRPRSRGIPRRWLRCSECIRSEEHTSELQSQSNLVCRLLLEKKKRKFGPKLVVTSTQYYDEYHDVAHSVHISAH